MVNTISRERRAFVVVLFTERAHTFPVNVDYKFFFLDVWEFFFQHFPKETNFLEYNQQIYKGLHLIGINIILIITLWLLRFSVIAHSLNSYATNVLEY